MSYKQTLFSLEKRQGPINKRVKLVFKLCLEGIDEIIRSSAGRDLVKTWAAWGKVCLKCLDKLSSHSMEGALLERLRSLCYAESEFLVLPGCPFSAPWQVFFLWPSLFLQMAVQYVGWLTRKAWSSIFNQSNSCFGGLAVGKHCGKLHRERWYNSSDNYQNRSVFQVAFCCFKLYFKK